MTSKHPKPTPDPSAPRQKVKSAPIHGMHVTFLGERSTDAPETIPRAHLRASRATREGTLDSASAAFFDALCHAGGVHAARYRHNILIRRQAACLRALRVACPVEGARTIRANPDAIERALGAVMIGVTGFFRDENVFRDLRLLLPSFRARPGLKALSVACSDGSELYSLAMLLAEEAMLTDARLWGLDCRPDAILTAKAGVYPADFAHQIPPLMRARCFSPAKATPSNPGRSRHQGPFLEVVEHIRSACAWVVADAFNLSKLSELPGEFDIIFCRNLAIYLTPDSAAELWSLLLSRLRPGGLLVVGKAERPSPYVRDSLTKVNPCIYRKHAGA